MSMWRYDFVVWGFDLSPFQDEIEEWINETDEGEAVYNRLSFKTSIGEWSLFTDPSGDSHCILGYVIAKADQADGFIRPVEVRKISFPGIDEIPIELWQQMCRFADAKEIELEPKIYVFTEWW